MRPLVSVLGLLALVGPLSAQVAPTARPDTSTCLRVDVDTVSLSGILERRTYPGRPNYESVANGDEAETYFYLVLASPFCVHPDSAAPDRQPLDGGTLLQLFLDKAGYDRLRPSLAHQLTLHGVLWEGISGHHHTPYLLTVVFP